MRRVIFCICVLGFCHFASAQRAFSTGSGVIKFVSTKNSDVSAVNNNVVVNVNEEGMINFELLVRDFRFDMAEMEEHFNKNYLESDKYPQAFFKGRIYSFKTINLTKPGLYKVKAEGDLSIHNVTKKIVVTGTLQVDKGVIVLQSKFSIDIDDYKIETGLGGMIVGSKMDVEVSARCFARTPSDAGAALWRGYDFP